MNTKALIDIRQTKEYARFMKKMGWKTKIIHLQRKTNSYFKKLPFLPFSVAKILRCSWPIQLTKLKKIKRDYHCLFIKVQPFLFSTELGLRFKSNPGVARLGIPGVKKTRGLKGNPDRHPLIPTKTIWIDLTKSKEQLLKEMKQKTRSNLKKAQKIKKLKTQIISGDKITKKQLHHFFRLWSKNKPFNWLFRANFNELKYLVDSFASRCFFILVWDLSCRAGSGSARELEVWSLTAGCLILQSSNMSFYWHNASTEKGKKLFAPTLSVWRAIEQSQKRGLKFFDFEGIYDARFPRSQKGWQGFTRFKKGFGGRQIEFTPPLII